MNVNGLCGSYHSLITGGKMTTYTSNLIGFEIFFVVDFNELLEDDWLKIKEKSC